MRQFFKFKMTATKRALLSIFDEIGPWGVSASAFRAGMNEIKDATHIDLEINSFGGDVFTGLAIYNMLKGSGKTIEAKVMGVAASAASLIMMAGDTRVMPKNTMVMVHNPWAVAMGNADDLRETADALDKVGLGLHATYAKATGLDDTKLKAMLSKDTWLTADESLEHGFATEVTDQIEAHAAFDIEAADIPAAAKAIYAKVKEKTEEEIEAERAQALIDEGKPVATAIFEMATKAGLTADHANFLAVASDSVEEGTKQVKRAAEIVAIAALAKRPAEEIKAMVRGGKTVADCRTLIMTAMAKEDEHTSTTKPVQQPNQPMSGLKPSNEIYAARAAAKKARLNNR